MARALWKGHLTFGLVNIPVELHPAVQDNTPRFRMLHKTDLSPISMERVCQTDGEPVAWQDLVKGYEIEPGRFITVTEDDFKTAAVEKSRSIEILDFVEAREIDGRFFDTPYWLRPAKGAESSYALMARALKESGRAGIAKYVMRNRQHLTAVQELRGGLCLTTLRFAEDLVDPSFIADLTPARADAREVKLALQLIEGLSREWEPTRYKDDYTANLLRVIEAKSKGSAPRLKTGERKVSANVVNLMERLQASLEATKGKQKTATSAKGKKVAASHAKKRKRAA
ncbi:MAG TPA: Ku protein [Vicinamibacterales bacterium]|nr:Ku protein [Vicinamibacterales bacterium]